MNISEVLDLLTKSNNVAIYSHINSDCDSMGSSLALKEALVSLGKNVDVYANSEFPATFAFYGDLSFVNKKTCEAYDLVVCVDVANESRLGKYKYTYRKGVKNTLAIDHHHLSNENFCKVNYVQEASSTAEILFEIINKLKIRFTKSMCKCLLSGILTDTGRLSHSVSEKTFTIVGRLLRYGKLSMEDVIGPLFNSMSKNIFALMQRAYNILEFYSNDKFAIIMFSKEDFIQTNTTLNDTDAFPDIPLQLKSVQFCILASEDDKGYFRVSFRSKGDISARDVAQSFGGGGHLNASGCKIFGPYAEVKEQLIDNSMQILGWKR